jgi:DNA-directed RNA polymerase specialized sigma subunit
MENELFDLVQKAQNGDVEALFQIISTFMPTIRSARKNMKRDRQDDLEQSIIETIIKKVLSYDISETPNFSAFCRKLNPSESDDQSDVFE